MSKAEERAFEAYPEQDMLRAPNTHKSQLNKERRRIYRQGYHQAEKDILAIIESRISEIIGDAQPKPILRLELKGLIKRIKDENKNT